MDLLLRHTQEKKEKRSNSISQCTLSLYGDDSFLKYESVFELDFHRYGTRKYIIFNHVLDINLVTGDFIIKYGIDNCGLPNDPMIKNTIKSKKNDFTQLVNLTEDGFFKGEKRKNYWGVKYKKSTDKIYNIINKKLKSKIKNEHLISKNHHEKYVVNELYDLIVDFHLDVKNIKGHDLVYLDIQEVYPKKKWLLKNENKFLPSILDSFGIKSKYMVSELNKNMSQVVYIKSLNYICKLFGENYLDYIKQINWKRHCYSLPPNNKIHVLKNESEKILMVGVINSWESNVINFGSFINDVNKLLSLRDFLEKKGLDLRFKARNVSQYEHLQNTWTSIKHHFSRGYKVRYTFEDSFIKTIEEDIIIDNVVYRPRVLITEDDFRVEGHLMKNCMGKQFNNGSIYIYISLQSNKKRINLQYRKGELNQSYGKANTPVIDIFQPAISVLNKRMDNFKDIIWSRDRYDFIII